MREEDNKGKKRNRYNEDDLSFVREKKGKWKSDKRNSNRARARDKSAFLDSGY